LNFQVLDSLSINSQDKDEFTPLHYAILSEHIECVNYLINFLKYNNISLETKNSYGYSPLHFAISVCKDVRIPTLLIRSGCKLNSENLEGETPIFDATRNSNKDMLKLLVQYGASTTIRNPSNQLALDFSTDLEISDILMGKIKLPSFVLLPTQEKKKQIVPQKATPQEEMEKLAKQFEYFVNLVRQWRPDANSIPESFSPYEPFNDSYSDQGLGNSSEHKTEKSEIKSEKNEKNEKSEIKTESKVDAKPAIIKKRNYFKAISNGRKKKFKAPLPVEKPVQDEFSFPIKIKDGQEFGNISLPNNMKLTQVRNLLKDNQKIPTNFNFFFPLMDSAVESHQENSMDVSNLGKEIILVISTIAPKTPQSPVSRVNLGEKEIILNPSLPKIKQTPEVQSTIFWKQHFKTSSTVSVQELIQKLIETYHTFENDSMEMKTIRNGTYSFFQSVEKLKNSPPTAQDLGAFLYLFGPIEKWQFHVYETYKNEYFLGFCTKERALEILPKKPGSFLVRFSSTKYDKGFFALNVYKKGSQEDNENYIIPYDVEKEQFTFRKNPYPTINALITNKEYSHILKFPYSKTEQIEQ